MKAYKLEILIIDHDECSAEGIESVITNANYPNDCIMPHVMKIEEAEIGEWHDNHPLNGSDTMEKEYNKLFPKFPIIQTGHMTAFIEYLSPGIPAWAKPLPEKLDTGRRVKVTKGWEFNNFQGRFGTIEEHYIDGDDCSSWYGKPKYRVKLDSGEIISSPVEYFEFLP